jgi:ABC-2 type transport system ATP-binding protein
MSEGSMIEALSLTKVYGGKAAVDGIDFQVKPGVVTGFLGPNGAGKSTTMRGRASRSVKSVRLV